MAQPTAKAVDLGALGAAWWSAFDAADAALGAAGAVLPGQELTARRSELRKEREATVRTLEALARERHEAFHFSQLLVSRPDLRRLLGLPRHVAACIFNLDGVLLPSAELHQRAWHEALDGFLAEHAELRGGRLLLLNALPPFDPKSDYARYLHGRPRLDGLRAFLLSRAIRVPDGERGDPPSAHTLWGLANRKNMALRRLLDAEGMTAYPGSRRYLEAVRNAGIERAVVSASANTGTILERSGLAALVDACVDGNTIAAQRLHPPPEPDALIAACRELGVEPGAAALFESSPAGVAAGRAAGFELVVAVEQAGDRDELGRQGADTVVTGLDELLDRAAAA
jgi:HAD superfamily hydrolase (TIGR01509 family)